MFQGLCMWKSVGVIGCIGVCVCVTETERERKGKRERERNTECVKRFLCRYERHWVCVCSGVSLFKRPKAWMFKCVFKHLAGQPLPLPLLLYHTMLILMLIKWPYYIINNISFVPKCISLSVYQICLYKPNSLSYSVTFALKYWWLWKHCSSSPYPLSTYTHIGSWTLWNRLSSLWDAAVVSLTMFVNYFRKLCF